MSDKGTKKWVLNRVILRSIVGTDSLDVFFSKSIVFINETPSCQNWIFHKFGFMIACEKVKAESIRINSIQEVISKAQKPI